ncbi:MAG: photosystem II stability/assembly factor-like uncharacterized protein [Hyphomicrobiaceae bacterium]|jgi:photosystem II stability/assembly factor-like uncharacterized protein
MLRAGIGPLVLRGPPPDTWRDMKTLRWSLLLSCLALSSCSTAPSRLPDAWLLVPSGTTASLRGLCAIDADVAFIGGSGGTLMRTIDGGNSWSDIAPPGSNGCDFRDVEAFDRNQVVAMVAGQPARVYRSDNAGVTWHIVHEDPRPSAFFDAMAFAGDYGVMFGDAIDGQFGLLQTADGGRTWRDRSGVMLPEPHVGEAAFAASGTCLVAVDGDAPVFSLATGGGPARMVKLGPTIVAGDAKNYWHRSLPLQSGASSKGAFSIAWNGSQGVAVGGDYQLPQEQGGTATWSSDGGDTWQQANALGFRSAVIWLDRQSLLSVGSHGASWSSDAGHTWAACGDNGYHSLSKGRDGSVWASGSDGRVARLLLPD